MHSKYWEADSPHTLKLRNAKKAAQGARAALEKMGALKEPPLKEPEREKPKCICEKFKIHDVDLDLKQAITPRAKAKEIVAKIAKKHRLTFEQIMSNSRFKTIVFARQEAMFVLYKNLKWSSPQIGLFFDKDHTTVLHALRKHKERSQGRLS